MSFIRSFTAYIKEHDLFDLKDHLLIAVSGGADSVVLCELCFRAGYHFSIAHCNFQLRGEESEGDAQFVKVLAEKYSVPFYTKQFETEKYAAENKISIQVAARELRYNWFSQLISQLNSKHVYLLTAHHADDNIETIAMNFFKGSGINGLKGILPKQNNILRPLLFATKEDIIEFAKSNKLAYREDSSNSSDKYTRNYFRNQVLPAIEKVFPQVKENLLNNAERFREINIIYQAAVQKILAGLLVTNGAEKHIPVLKLQATAAMPSVLYEIIKDYGFTSGQTTEVIKLLSSESGKYVESATHRILRNRKWLIISPLNDTTARHYIIEKGTSEINFAAGKLMLQLIEGAPEFSKDPLIAQLDNSLVEFPLLLRKWKTGDYFYPLGMKKKKKISRFLTDLKLSLNQKQEVWVVESNKKIVWVAGHRIDDRFKITPNTNAVCSIELSPE